MQVIPLGPKRVKLLEIKNYKVIGNMFNLEYTIKEKKHYKKKKEKKSHKLRTTKVNRIMFYLKLMIKEQKH